MKSLTCQRNVLPAVPERMESYGVTGGVPGAQDMSGAIRSLMQTRGGGTLRWPRISLWVTWSSHGLL